MDSLIKIAGSSGLMENNTAQRCWRDVHAISRGDELGRAGGKLRTHRVRASAEPGLSYVLI